MGLGAGGWDRKLVLSLDAHVYYRIISLYTGQYSKFENSFIKKSTFTSVYDYLHFLISKYPVHTS